MRGPRGQMKGDRQTMAIIRDRRTCGRILGLMKFSLYLNRIVWLTIRGSYHIKGSEDTETNKRGESLVGCDICALFHPAGGP